MCSPHLKTAAPEAIEMGAVASDSRNILRRRKRLQRRSAVQFEIVSPSRRPDTTPDEPAREQISPTAASRARTETSAADLRNNAEPHFHHPNPADDIHELEKFLHHSSTTPLSPTATRRNTLERVTEETEPSAPSTARSLVPSAVSSTAPTNAPLTHPLIYSHNYPSALYSTLDNPSSYFLALPSRVVLNPPPPPRSAPLPKFLGPTVFQRRKVAELERMASLRTNDGGMGMDGALEEGMVRVEIVPQKAKVERRGTMDGAVDEGMARVESTPTRVKLHGRARLELPEGRGIGGAFRVSTDDERGQMPDESSSESDTWDTESVVTEFR